MIRHHKISKKNDGINESPMPIKEMRAQVVVVKTTRYNKMQDLYREKINNIDIYLINFVYKDLALSSQQSD